MAELGLDIRTLYAQVVGGEREFLFGQWPGRPLGWSAVQKLFETSEVQVQMILRVLTEGAQPSWEWNSLPPQATTLHGERGTRAHLRWH